MKRLFWGAVIIFGLVIMFIFFSKKKEGIDVSQAISESKDKVIREFVPDNSSTLSVEGQLHNAIQKARGMTQKMIRDLNSYLSHPDILRKVLLQGNRRTYGSLTFKQLVDAAISKGIIGGITQVNGKWKLL